MMTLKFIKIFPIINTILYLSIIFWFKQQQVWVNYFIQPSNIYIIDNFIRVLFLAYLAWLFYFVGSIISHSLLVINKKLSPINHYLLSSYLGIAFYSIAFLLVGYLGFYYVWVAVLCTAPVIFFSSPQLSRYLCQCRPIFKEKWCHFNKNTFAYRAFFLTTLSVIIIQLLFLLVMKGLMPGLGSNDAWWQYYPYFINLTEKFHGIRADHWYIYQNFISNGMGIFALTTLLSDMYSLQLLSFYNFLLMLVVLALLVQSITQEKLWALLAVILLIFSKDVMPFEFYKNHILLNAFILLSIYFCPLIKTYPSIKKIQAIFLMIPIIYSPMAFAFVLPLIMIQIVYYKMQGYSIWFFKSTLILCSGTFLTMVMVNYYLLGMGELIPFDLFIRFANMDIMAQWVDPVALLFIKIFRIPIANGDMDFTRIFSLLAHPNYILNPAHWTFLDSKMFPYYGMILLPTILLLSRFKQNSFVKNQYIFIVLAFLVFTLLLMVVTTQASIVRFSFFRIFLRVFVYVAVIYSVISLLPLKLRRPTEIVSLFCLILFSLNMVKENFRIEGVDVSSFVNHHKIVELYKNAIPFLTGKISYGDLYHNRWGYVHSGIAIQQRFPNEKILSLNPIVGFSTIPNNRFQQGLMGDYVQGGQYQKLLLSDAESAKSVLQNNGLNYVFIDTRIPFWYFAYSPLFEVQNLAEYFKIALLSDDGFTVVLTWREAADPVEARFVSFIATYKEKIDSFSFEQSSPYAIPYRYAKRLLAKEGKLDKALIEKLVRYGWSK